MAHGEDGDFEFSVDPGKYKLKFVSTESSSFKGATTLEVNGDVNASYEINCMSDKVSVSVEYVERPEEVGENEIMMKTSEADYKHKNYKDVESELKKLGFENIKTNILYDIYWGLIDEGEVENVTVAGKEDFKREDIFANNDEIIITYHMKEEDDPKNMKEESAEKEENNTESKEKTKADGKVNFSSNTYEKAKKGNKGVFSYKKSGKFYDIYYIINFDEGYVYYFLEGEGNNFCDKMKISSGTLNDTVEFIMHDDNSAAVSWYVHFKYKNFPETIVVVDDDGFTYEFKATSLKKALSLRKSKKNKLQ